MYRFAATTASTAWTYTCQYDSVHTLYAVEDSNLQLWKYLVYLVSCISTVDFLANTQMEILIMLLL